MHCWQFALIIMNRHFDVPILDLSALVSNFKSKSFCIYISGMCCTGSLFA